MIVEIQARSLLIPVKHPENWFGVRWNMNIYRGCEHRCIYCDSRSQCYGIENFDDVLVKVNAIALLEDQISRKRTKGLIGSGSMSDPYTYAERRYELTLQSLQVIARHGFPAHLITKSDMVLRDLDLLLDINRVHAEVGFTVTTCDDELASRVEPGAPSSTRRLDAMAKLSAAGITTGVLIMPVLPWIEDSEDNIREIMRRAKDCGAVYAASWFGLSMRDRQREHLYAQLDRLFPGLSRRYQRAYGERYSCPSPNAGRLAAVFYETCEQLGLKPGTAPLYPRQRAEQLSLF